MRLFFSRKHQERKSGDDMPLPPLGSSLEGDGVEPNTEHNTWATYGLGGVEAEEVAGHRQGRALYADEGMQATQASASMSAVPVMTDTSAESVMLTDEADAVAPAAVAPAMPTAPATPTRLSDEVDFAAEVEPQASRHSELNALLDSFSKQQPVAPAPSRGMDPAVLKQLEMVTANLFASEPSRENSVVAAVTTTTDATTATAYDDYEDEASDYVDEDEVYEDESYGDEEDDAYVDDDYADDDYADTDAADDYDADESANEVAATSVVNDSAATAAFAPLGGQSATPLAPDFASHTEFNSSTNDGLSVSATSNAGNADLAAAVASMMVRENLEAHGSQETDGIGSPDGSSASSTALGECEFKLEEVDSLPPDDTEPPTLTPYLDEDDFERQERLGELLAERAAAAQKQELVSLKVGSAKFFDARLQNTQLIRVHTPTILDDDTEHGKMETDEFITGNVTILATGTDNISATTAGGARRIGHGDEDDTEAGEDADVELAEILPSKEDFRSSVSLGYDASLRPREPKLVPLLLQDTLKNCLVYFLAVVACLLCLAKIYQVQETRELTSCLNEVSLKNTDLENEKLSLLATSQTLSEYIKVSTFAREKLDMQAPKVESEHVISL